MASSSKLFLEFRKIMIVEWSSFEVITNAIAQERKGFDGYNTRG